MGKASKYSIPAPTAEDCTHWVEEIERTFECVVTVMIAPSTGNRSSGLWSVVWTAAFPAKGVLEPRFHYNRKLVPCRRPGQLEAAMFQGIVALWDEVKHHQQTKFWRKGGDPQSE